MRRGCIIATAITALVLLIGGYFGYKFFKDLVAIPDDLKPYKESGAVLSMVKSHASPPPKGSLLTEKQLDLYLEALDSVGKGFMAFRKELDSMGLTDPNDESAENLLKSASAIRPILLYSVITRRAIVNFLNRHNLSLDEYEWIRRRVIAASKITQQEFDSLHKVMIPPNTFLSGLYEGLESEEPLWVIPSNSVSQLPRHGTLYSEDAVDSTEILLVRPHHARILHNGFASLVGVERLMRTNLKDGNVSVNLNEKKKKE